MSYVFTDLCIPHTASNVRRPFSDIAMQNRRHFHSWTLSRPKLFSISILLSKNLHKWTYLSLLIIHWQLLVVNVCVCTHELCCKPAMTAVYRLRSAHARTRRTALIVALHFYSHTNLNSCVYQIQLKIAPLPEWRTIPTYLTKQKGVNFALRILINKRLLNVPA